MEAVVYKSKTGNTKKYAKFLAKRMNVSCFDVKDVDKNLNLGDEVIFLGWVCANNIAGLEKVKKKYKVKVICAVGMPKEDQEQYNKMVEIHHK